MKNVTRLRILYLYRILVEQSDADHPVSAQQLIQNLGNKYGIQTTRFSVTEDLKTLRELNFPFALIRSRQNKYYYDGQLFKNAELKLLIDAVASSQFISESKSKNLIHKLCGLTNFPNMEILHRNSVRFMSYLLL